MHEYNESTCIYLSLVSTHCVRRSLCDIQNHVEKKGDIFSYQTNVQPDRFGICCLETF